MVARDMKPKKPAPNPADWARRMRFPLSEWPGQCYAVAQAALKAKLVPGGTLRYGMWWGPISDDCLFAGKPLTHHAWIEQPRRGLIVDPTRYVFEGAAPYIWIGTDPHGWYDAGSNRVLAAMAGMPPRADEGDTRTYQLTALPPETCKWLADCFPDPFDHRDPEAGTFTVTRRQAFWLANLPIERPFHTIALKGGPPAAPLFRALERVRLGVLIPIDNRRLVLGAR
ncbi:MAG TPA: hypothetical protein VIW28_00515 [Gemmatimonadales bacterium]